LTAARAARIERYRAPGLHEPRGPGRRSPTTGSPGRRGAKTWGRPADHPWNTVGAPSDDREDPVPGRSKTASAAIAAVVVAAAAAAAPLLNPSLSGAVRTAPSSGPAARADAPSGGTVRPGSRPGSSSEASGLPVGRAGGPTAAAPTSVLFLGRSRSLRPSGGSAQSFACRAALALRWRCQVWSGAPSDVPAAVTANLLVVAVGPQDDAAWVASALDGVPSGLATARRVVLGPLLAPATDAARRRLAAIRSLAAARGLTVIDPAAAGWLPSGPNRYLAADGQQLTLAGQAYLGTRLATALRPFVG
jgi:hypothetical protein